MYGDCRKVVATELVSYPVCARLGCREHNSLRLGILVLLDKVAQVLELFALFYYEVRLLDGVKRDFLLVKPDVLYVLHVLLCKPEDLRRHGCGEQACLPFIVDIEQDELDVIYESHVKHPISLVQDNELDIVKYYRTLLDVVDESSRRCDHYLDTTPYLLHLYVYALSAVDGNCSYPCVLCQPTNFICYLHRKFSCRHKHQRLDRALVAHSGQNGQSKCCRLAGSCVRLPNYISTSQDKRDSCFLDGERRYKSILAERLG